MMAAHFIIGMIPVAIFVLGVNTVCSQEFPSKPVHLVTSEGGRWRFRIADNRPGAYRFARSASDLRKSPDFATT